MFIRSSIVTALVVGASLMPVAVTHADPGDPTTSFGSDGVDHWHDFGAAGQIASLKDGSIIVGNTYFDDQTETNTSVSVARFTSDDAQVWFTSIPKKHVSIQLVDMLVHDERIDLIMSDFIKQGQSETRIARLRQDGSPDPGWNGGKSVTLSDVTKFKRPVTAIATPDGGILLVAENRLVKLTSKGKVDKDFSGDGVLTLKYPTKDAYPTDLTRMKNGDLALAFITDDFGTGYRAYIMVLHPDGALKKSFGKNGLREVVIPKYDFAIIDDLDVLPNGDFALAVSVRIDFEFGSRYPSAVAVVSGTTGKFVKSFSGNGYEVFKDTTDNGCCVAVQSDGRILVGAMKSRSWRIMRLMPDGTPDNSFAKKGTLVVKVGEAGRSYLEDMAFDRKNDRLLLAGREEDDLGGVYIAFGSFSLV